MGLIVSIVKDAALTWFGELGYAVGHGLKDGGNLCDGFSVVWNISNRKGPKP